MYMIAEPEILLGISYFECGIVPIGYVYKVLEWSTFTLRSQFHSTLPLFFIIGCIHSIPDVSGARQVLVSQFSIQ